LVTGSVAMGLIKYMEFMQRSLKMNYSSIDMKLVK
jgi:hypothetical protein